MLARHFTAELESVSDLFGVVDGLRELDMFCRCTWSLLQLLSCADKDIEMADTEEVHYGEDENNICIYVLGATEPVLVIQERTEDRADELAQPRACYEYSADVVV